MNRHALRTGEYLAISPDAIKHDEAGFFIVLGPSAPENERHGTIAVVHIRGAIAQFDEGEGDSYEAIVRRVHEAMYAEDKPEAVVLRISSPGGVVAGLNESVLKLRKMSRESGVRLIAYVDEIAASAAFAICCACEERVGPPSAIIGSVGVISTMVSEVKKDALEGREFRLITSGARKADGHLHAPISDGAVSAEEKRNAQLAQQFFRLASDATGLSVKKLASLEASIYLAEDAVRVGLADSVMGWDEVCLALGCGGTTELLGKEGERGGNVTDRRAKEKALDTPAHNESTSTAQRDSRQSDHQEADMLKLDALIAKAEAAVAGEIDPKKKARLAAQLAQFEATKRAMSDGGDEDDDQDEDDEDSKAKKAAAKAEEAKRKAAHAKHMEAAAKHKQKAAEYEEKAKKCLESEEEDDEEEEEEEEEASLSRARQEAASADAGREAAIASGEALRRVSELELKDRKRERQAMIDDALQKRRISPAEAKTLAKKDHAFVTAFLEMRPRAIVRSDDEELSTPDAREGAELPKDALAEIDRAVSAMKAARKPDGTTYTVEELATLRTSMIEANRKAMAETNGIGRY